MNLSRKGILGSVLAVIFIVLCFTVTKSNAVEPGYYIKAGLGWSWAEDANFREDDPTSDPFLYITFPSAVGGDELDDIGDSPIISGGIGYRFNESFRTDITISHRWGFELDEADIAGTIYEADIESTAYMINGYYDIPVDMGRFRPFFGVGIGFARNKLDKLEWYDPTPASGKIPGGTNTDFAWQLMLGTVVEISERCGIEFGYRYHDAGEIEKDAGFGATGWYTGPATGDLRAHEAMIEFIYLFRSE